MSLVGSINFMLGMESNKFTAGANRGIKDLNRMQSEAHSLRASLGGVNSALGAIGIGVGIHQVIGFLREAHAAAEEAEQQQRKLAAVLEATGGAAGLSAEQMGRHADALSKIAAVDDDVITGAQAILATFRNVKGDVFQEGTALALDMSRVMGSDLQGAILQVGKALNDPILGITALRRAGVSFTEDQKATIKSMMQMNDVAGAQRIILEELAAEFGGAAAKMRSSWAALGLAADQYKEAIGNIGQTADGKGLADWLAGQVDRATEDVDRFTKTIEKDAPIWEKAWRFAQAFGAVGGVQNLIGPNDPFLENLPTESDAGPTRPDRPLPPSEAALRKLITDVGPAFAKGFTDELPGLGEMLNRMQEQERGMRGGAFGNDPVGRALLAQQPAAMPFDPAGLIAGLGGAIMQGLEGAVDVAIRGGNVLNAAMAALEVDEPPGRSKRFAGAAMRGSEEAFATIAAFQGSAGRSDPPTKEQQNKQLDAIKELIRVAEQNVLEVEVAAIP